MANDRLLDMIPVSIRPQLIDEVKELLAAESSKGKTQPDNELIAFAKKQNEAAIKNANKTK